MHMTKLTTTIGTNNNRKGETESNDLFIVVGGEGTYSSDGKLGDGCHYDSQMVVVGIADG